MRALGVSTVDLEIAAHLAGVGLRGVREDAKEIHFRLQAQRDSWRVRDSRGRLTAAVCLHGHWQFFRALFNRVEGAQIRSSLTRRMITLDSLGSIGRSVSGDGDLRRLRLCECPHGIDARRAGVVLNCDRCTSTRACADHRYYDDDYF